MDSMSLLFGVIGLMIGVLSVILTVVFYLKPLIDKSLTILGKVETTLETQEKLLEQLTKGTQRGNEDHIGIINRFEIIKGEIINETTERVVERIRDLLNDKR